MVFVVVGSRFLHNCGARRDDVGARLIVALVICFAGYLACAALSLPDAWTISVAGGACSARACGRLARPLATTAARGAATSLASLTLAVAWLESEQRGPTRARVRTVCLSLPPQSPSCSGCRPCGRDWTTREAGL